MKDKSDTKHSPPKGRPDTPRPTTRGPVRPPRRIHPQAQAVNPHSQ